MGSDRQMWNGFCIASIKKINLESSWALTDRFVMESALILLRKWIWRDLGSEESSCALMGKFATASPLVLLRESTWRLPGLWWASLWQILYCFDQENEPGGPWALMGRFAKYFGLKSNEIHGLWRAYLQWSLYRFLLDNELGEPWALTARIVLDFVSIPLRHGTWTGLGSHSQICNGFCIDFFQNISLEKLELWLFNCHSFWIDFIREWIQEGSGLWQCDLLLVLYDLFKHWSLTSSGIWQRDLLLMLYWFHKVIKHGGLCALIAGFGTLEGSVLWRRDC